MNRTIIRASELHFRTGRKDEAEELVINYHYSKRIPSNVVMIGSLHLDGGLFGGDGDIVAAAFWSIPPTRWSEKVIELSRLVRAKNQVPLTMLISKSIKQLKKKMVIIYLLVLQIKHMVMKGMCTEQQTGIILVVGNVRMTGL